MRKEPAANAAGVIDELDRTSQQPPLALTSSRQISSARRFCLPLGATAPVSAMLKPTLIGSAARGHCGPVDDRAQNCERDAQNGASCGGKHRADLLTRHDGSDRSSPRALLVARAKVKRGRPRRDTIERWPICRVGRRKILQTLRRSRVTREGMHSNRAVDG